MAQAVPPPAISWQSPQRKESIFLHCIFLFFLVSIFLHISKCESCPSIYILVQPPILSLSLSLCCLPLILSVFLKGGITTNPVVLCILYIQHSIFFIIFLPNLLLFIYLSICLLTSLHLPPPILYMFFVKNKRLDSTVVQSMLYPFMFMVGGFVLQPFDQQTTHLLLI